MRLMLKERCRCFLFLLSRRNHKCHRRRSGPGPVGSGTTHATPPRAVYHYLTSARDRRLAAALRAACARRAIRVHTSSLFLYLNYRIARCVPTKLRLSLYSRKLALKSLSCRSVVVSSHLAISVSRARASNSLFSKQSAIGTPSRRR